MSFFPLTDSREQVGYPAQRRAGPARGLDRQAADRRPVRFGGEELAQVAQPLKTGDEAVRVALYSRASRTRPDAWRFVRNRMLVATAVALLLALAGGTLVAQSLARRVRRLERARGRARLRPLHRARCRWTPRTSSASSPARSTRWSSSCGRSTCARKEFIATASHELRTPIFSLSGLRRAAAGRGARRGDPARVPRHDGRAGRSGCRSCPSTCSTCRASTPARSSCSPESLDLAELARAVAREFRPAVSPTRDRARRWTSRTDGVSALATPKGWPRSCVSCSTTPSATPRRAHQSP